MRLTILLFLTAFVVGLCLIQVSPVAATPQGRILKASGVADRAPDGRAATTRTHGAPAKMSDWEEIEHSSYAQLIANLRRVGCPEQTIRDIVLARTERDYARMHPEGKNPLRQNWMSLPEMHQQTLARWGEQSQLLASHRLPVPVRTGQAVASATDQLSPEKQEAIARISQQFPHTPVSPVNYEADQELASRNRRERLNYLKDKLTPEELFNYRLEQDSNAKTVARYLFDLNLTEEEFRKVCFVLDFTGIKNTNGRLAEDAERQLEEGLGKERYAQYRELNSFDNVQLKMAFRGTGVTPEALQRVRELRSQQLAPEQMQTALEQVLQPEQRDRYYNMFPEHRPSPFRQPDRQPAPGLTP